MLLCLLSYVAFLEDMQWHASYTELTVTMLQCKRMQLLPRHVIAHLPMHICQPVQQHHISGLCEGCALHDWHAKHFEAHVNFHGLGFCTDMTGSIIEIAGPTKVLLLIL